MRAFYNYPSSMDNYGSMLFRTFMVIVFCVEKVDAVNNFFKDTFNYGNFTF